jgi:hypothetical protein
MGRVLAEELASSDIPLSAQLAHHLRGNHYPPVPIEMVEPCIKAIDTVQRAQWGDASSSDLVELPNGVSYRGETSAPAYALVESFHLDAFIEWDGE